MHETLHVLLKENEVASHAISQVGYTQQTLVNQSASIQLKDAMIPTTPDPVYPCLANENQAHALSDFLIVKLGLKLPYVLQTLRDRCTSTMEATLMCQRMCMRFYTIFQQLCVVNKTERETPLKCYSELITRFHHFVLKHSRLNFATRVVLCLQETEDILLLHRDLDQVEHELSLPLSSVSPDIFHQDREAQLQSFWAICDNTDAVAANIECDRAKLDALILVRNVRSRHRSSTCSEGNYYWGILERLEEQLAALCPIALAVIVAEWFVPPYQVECDEQPFSRGSFGAVYHGRMKGADVVVKRMLSDGADARESFLNEVHIWSQLRHPHILTFLGACHGGQLFIICDHATKGTLPAFLKASNDRQLTWHKLYEIALGLQHLHSLEIIHGDLKGNNLLVGADGKAKVADFGLSRWVTSSCMQPAAEAGAPRWTSPEILTGNSISMASDIYAFGMCVVEAVSGEYPWGNVLPDVAVIRNVKRGTALLRPNGFSDEQWELVTRMTAFEQSKRVRIAAVVETLANFHLEELDRKNSGQIA